MIVLRLLSRLPFWLLYGLADVIFVVGFYIIRYRRKLVVKNLMKSFPERSLFEIKKIEKHFYRSLSDYVVETLKLLTISEAELKKRMVYKNPELVKEFTKNNQSVLLFASHQFNWEWSLAAGTFSLDNDIDFVYQVQGSTLFNNFLLKIRTRFGAYPIQREQVAREVAKRRSLVRGIAIVADQFPGLSTDKRYWTTFLNQDTAFFQATNQLAVLTQYPAFYSGMRKVRRGHYEIELVKIGAPPYDKATFHIIDNYTKATEKLIAISPENWLWSHNRWKKDRSIDE